MVRTAKEKMAKAKARLILEQPFFGVLLTSTDIIEDEACETAATDGIKIYYSPKFFDTLDDEGTAFVLLHEVSHIILMHCDKKRRGSKTNPRWNYAVDYVVNWMIDSLGGRYKVLKGSLYDSKYKDMTAEQVYKSLPEDSGNDNGRGGKKGQQTKDGSGKAWQDQHRDMDENSDAHEEMKGKILAAAEATKDKGSLPAGMSRMIDELKKSKVNWKNQFRHLIGTVVSNDDYSWTPPHAAYIWRELYLPSLHSEKIGQIIVAVDTSGSIGQKELSIFAPEMASIGQHCEEVIAMSCDTKVHEVVKVKEFEKWSGKLEFLGGGGTSFKPVFEEIKKMKARPQCLVFFTDGYGDWEDCKRPSYPVIWVVTSTKKPTFGRAVYIDEEV